jgi:CHAP domain
MTAIEATLERVTAIRQALADPAALIGSSGSLTGGTEGPSSTGTAAATAGSSFAAALEQAAAGYDTSSEGSSASANAAALEYTNPDTAALLEGSGATSATGLSGTTGLTDAASVTPYYGLQSLDGVVGASGLSAVGSEDVDSPGARIVAIAESQIGQTEQPPGSNESPAIAQYRTATAGAAPGAPWCAYFASWVTSQAGEPIGQGGQGAGAVSDVWSWAQSTGRAITNGPGVVPQPGDLIVFGDEHVGIVKDVLPNGDIQTIEGNYENKVAANVRTPTEATGYVNMN